MIKLDDNLLAELGLSGLPKEEKSTFLKHMYETLEMRVGTRLAEKMSDAQMSEFEQFINSNDEQGAFHWLEANFPNYKDVVAEEFEKLKGEIKPIAPQILASSQQHAQQQVGQDQSGQASQQPQPVPQAQTLVHQQPQSHTAQLQSQPQDASAHMPPPQQFHPQAVAQPSQPLEAAHPDYASEQPAQQTQSPTPAQPFSAQPYAQTTAQPIAAAQQPQQSPQPFSPAQPTDQPQPQSFAAVSQPTVDPSQHYQQPQPQAVHPESSTPTPQPTPSQYPQPVQPPAYNQPLQPGQPAVNDDQSTPIHQA